MMDEKFKAAVSRVGAAWMVARPWRKRLVRRLMPDMAAGLDRLEEWAREWPT